jgi:outer membrane protein TolC
MKLSFITILLLLFIIPVQAQYSPDSCKKLALQNNAAIKNADIEIQTAEKTKEAAFTKYFPEVQATGFAFKSNASMIDMNADDADIDVTFENQTINDILQTLYSNYWNYIPDATVNIQMTDDGLMGGITALEPVYAGGRIRHGNQLAGLGIEAAELKKNIAVNEVELKTEEYYWRIVSLKEKLNTIAAAEMLLDTLYKDVNGAYQTGVIIENDLLKVKLKKNEIQSKRLKLENGIALSTMALSQFTGIAYSDTLQFDDLIQFNDSILPPWQYYASHASVVQNRDEYKLLDLSVAAEQKRKQMLLGETMPQLAVGTAYLYNNLMEKHNTNAVVFATVSIPISAWWEAGYNMQKQSLELAKAENNRRDLNEKLLLQMQQAWNDVTESYQQAVLSREAIAEATQNLKVAMDYYHAGMTTVSEVLESQSVLQQCRDSYVEQLVQYKIKLLCYLQMTSNQ